DRSLPAHLPREEIVHLPASGDCVCPACGGALRRLAEDADEMLDIEPIVFKVIRHVRPKFSCRACEKIVQAPAPDKAIARGKASFRMIGHIIVSKFDHHLPLYRQAEMMAAQGVDIDRSTLAGWTGQGAALLDPIVARIRDMVLSASKLHTDDTPVPMLDPGSGKTKTARLWVHAIDDRAHGGLAKPAVWFAFTTDRRAEHPKSMLKDFRGHLQADAYPGYDDLYRTGRIVEVDPTDHDFPTGFNILDHVPIERRPFVASSVVDCFKAIWGSSWGPQLEMFLYAGAAALLDFPDGTLVGLKFLITSKSYRTRVLGHIRDPAVRDFWKTDFQKHMPEKEQRLHHRLNRAWRERARRQIFRLGLYFHSSQNSPSHETIR